MKTATPKKARKATRERAVVSGGRGSPEAIEKRRVARQLNAMLTKGSGGAAEATLDGRTARKRERLISDLKKRALKPIEVLSRVSDLMGMGETLSSIKKLGVKPLKTAFAADTEEAGSAIDAVQSAYGFPVDAWKFVGVTLDRAEAAE